jgi:uncharacterized lipoprotein YmbA
MVLRAVALATWMLDDKGDPMIMATFHTDAKGTLPA